MQVRIRVLDGMDRIGRMGGMRRAKMVFGLMMAEEERERFFDGMGRIGRVVLPRIFAD